MEINTYITYNLVLHSTSSNKVLHNTSFGSDTLVELVIRLDTGGQSKVPEQLGHDKRSGAQPRYLSLKHKNI